MQGRNFNVFFYLVVLIGLINSVFSQTPINDPPAQSQIKTRLGRRIAEITTKEYSPITAKTFSTIFEKSKGFVPEQLRSQILGLGNDVNVADLKRSAKSFMKSFKRYTNAYDSRDSTVPVDKVQAAQRALAETVATYQARRSAKALLAKFFD